MSHKTETSRKRTTPRRNAVVLGDRGRIVLPAAVRKELDLEPGSKMTIDVEEDGTIRLRPYAAIARSSMGMLADIAPPDVSLVDELIAERRREAKREEERFAEYTKAG
jgi:AbrB family looped-hinge helix DNA binding protein